jgi:hypothetical protein
MGWYTDRDFLDGDGRPLDLDAEGAAGFDALYQRYSGSDVPQSTMLRELMAVGAVEKTPSGRLRVRTRYFRPAATDTHAVERAGHVLSDLGQTIRHNMFRPQESAARFEGRAWSAVIPKTRAEAFHAFLDERAQGFLEEVDAWLVANEDPGGDPASHIRLGAGAYEIRTIAADVPRGADIDDSTAGKGKAGAKEKGDEPH